MVRPFDLTHDLRSAKGKLTTLRKVEGAAISPTLAKENRRQNRGNPNGDLSVGLLCRSIVGVVSGPLIGLRSNIQGFNFSLGSSVQVQNYDYKRNKTFRLAKHDEHIVELK